MGRPPRKYCKCGSGFAQEIKSEADSSVEESAFSYDGARKLEQGSRFTSAI